MPVEPNDVEEIYDTDLTPQSLRTWINIAEDVVDDLDEDEFRASKERVTLLLSAHLASAQDKRIASGSQGASSVNFEGRTGMRLNATQYGQAVQLVAPELNESAGPGTRGAIFETIGEGEK